MKPPFLFILSADSLLLVAIVIIILIALSFGIKSYYSNLAKSKIEGYKGEISKSHTRILKLEVKNEKLKNQIKELEALNDCSKTA